ncbi:aromatic prenyltransferase [Penicillium robsamsonii]|uniref:aromatic prenyltransferase n=1 Tax=Penicillium robsamsonii TaxID=1792511 RepID=UPI0025496134|nr:aromatic prenyltransferase [Penicillium robsamsonii]KAJ5823673.1 aromatic prenyltransferase [Penicillium robsamsonii]
MTLISEQLSRPSSSPVKAKNVEQNVQPWQTLDQFMKFEGPDHRLWWERMAPIIGAHLKNTKYSIGAQYQHLLMLHSTILPTLGPFPNENRSNLIWPSCLPGGGEPWEISVNYREGSNPCFRMAVEPSGPDAGTERDPVNDVAARNLLNALNRLQPGVDFDLFNYFDDVVTFSNREARQHWDSLKLHRIKSQEVIALDLQDGSFAIKPYIVPLVRSIATGVDPIRIMLDSIKEYWQGTPLTAGLSKVDDYLSTTKHPLLEAKSFLSFDCKDPKTSRVKIYAGANITSLEDAHDFWSLGGRLQGDDIIKGWELVKKVWEFVYPKSLPGGKTREYLTFNWNWELSPTDPNPAPKAYFLLCDDYDKHVTEALVALFAGLGWNDHISTHQKIQEDSYPTYDFETSSKVYTWIAIAFSERTGPYITVYSNPAASF